MFYKIKNVSGIDDHPVTMVLKTAKIITQNEKVIHKKSNYKPDFYNFNIDAAIQLRTLFF